MITNEASVILGPLVTEKANFLSQGSVHRVYVFKVSLNANKISIKKDIQKMFSVVPVSCSLLNIRRKRRANLPYGRNVRKGYGWTSLWRKAYVTLTRGQVISEFEA